MIDDGPRAIELEGGRAEARRRGRVRRQQGNSDDQIFVGVQVGGAESPGRPSGCVLLRVYRGGRRRVVPQV